MSVPVLSVVVLLRAERGAGDAPRASPIGTLDRRRLSPYEIDHALAARRPGVAELELVDRRPTGSSARRRTASDVLAVSVRPSLPIHISWPFDDERDRDRLVALGERRAASPP